jgi:hypothetical protein
MDIDIVS